MRVLIDPDNIYYYEIITVINVITVRRRVNGFDT